MRYIFAILATLVVAQCATSDDDRFRVGQSERAFVIIGAAEAAANTSATYDVLWRRLDSDGAFEPVSGRTAFQVETNERGTLRAPGIPGEFALREIEPGTYALDSVFAVIRDRRVDYVANGVITGPERPSFEVHPGEAIYLGIWQADIQDSLAVVHPWRMDEADLRAILEHQDKVLGDVRLRETELRAVNCSPHRLNDRSRRQVC